MASETVIRGTLFLFSETGTEGGWFSIQDEKFIVDNCMCVQPGWELLYSQAPEPKPHSHWSYEGLHSLSDGDHLKVFAPDGSIYWEGDIKLKTYPVFTESVTVQDTSTGASLGLWIHADQMGLDRHFWATPFMKEYRGELTKKEKA
jgi:hypothetical protein